MSNETAMAGLPAALPSLTVHRGDELLAADLPAYEWIVPGLLPAQGVMILAGPPKSMKSLLSLQAALCVAAGSNLWGLGVEKHGPVLFVEQEGSLTSLRDRLAKQSEALGIAEAAERLHIVSRPNDPDLRLTIGSEAGGWALLTEMVRRIKPALIVLDPLAFLMDAEENANSEIARKVMLPLQQFSDEAGCLILVIHHTNKPSQDRNGGSAADRIRGASAFRAGTDANVVVDRPNPDDGIVHLEGEYREAEPLSVWLRLDPATLVLSNTEPPTKADAKLSPERAAEWVIAQGKRVSVAMAQKGLSVSWHTANDALWSAYKAGLVGQNQDPDGRKSRWFYDLALGEREVVRGS